jgi:hypothetical protein
MPSSSAAAEQPRRLADLARVQARRISVDETPSSSGTARTS